MSAQIPDPRDIPGGYPRHILEHPLNSTRISPEYLPRNAYIKYSTSTPTLLGHYRIILLALGTLQVAYMPYDHYNPLRIS